MAKLKIAKGTQAAYDNLWRKDNDTFYVCTDSQHIYLGVTLLFSGDRYKSFLIDNNDNVIITTFGVNGAITVNLSDYTSTYDAAQAILSAVDNSYKFIRNIAPEDITESLLSSSESGYVYDVYYGFTIGSGTGDVSSDLFVSSASGKSYPAGTSIVAINTGTPEDPVYKFDVLTASEADLSNYKTRQSPKTDPTASGTTLDFIDSIIQNENGEITATKKTIQTVSNSQSGVMTSEMYAKLNESQAEYTIISTTPDEGYLAAYQLTQDDVAVGVKINIPKDFLVKSGSVIDVVEYNGSYYDSTDIEHTNSLPLNAAGKYLDFVINVQSGTATDQHIYISVSDLVDVYTEGNGISISNSNVVSVRINNSNSNGLSLDSNGLSLGIVVSSVGGLGGSSGAMTAQQAEKLANIEDGAEVNVQADWNENTTTSDSHVLNRPNIRKGTESTAIIEGDISNNTATGQYSHSEGRGTKSLNIGEHSEGNYNWTYNNSGTYGNSGNVQHSIGIGTADDNRKNAITITQNGDLYVYGVNGYQGTGTTQTQSIQNYITNIDTKILIDTLEDSEYDGIFGINTTN